MFHSMLRRVVPVVWAQESPESPAEGAERAASNADATAPAADEGAEDSEPAPAKSNGKGKRGGSRKVLRAPPFDQREGMLRRVLSPMTFDGLQVEINKPISPAFSVMHGALLGSQHTPAQAGGGTYSFGAQLSSMSSFSMARWHLDGRVEARHIRQPVSNVTAKFTALLSPQPHSSQLMVDADIAGSDYTAQLRIGSGTVVSASYFQSITEELCAGAEGMYHGGRGIVTSTYAARYVQPGWTVYGTATSEGRLSGAYLRKVSDRVRLATDLVIDATQQSAVMNVGAEFALKKGKVNVGLTNTGVLSAMVEEKVNPAVSVQLAAELDHARGDYKFGFGMSMG